MNTFFSNTKIINGNKSLEHIVNELISLQSKHPLIIASKSCKKNIKKIYKAFYNSDITVCGTFIVDSTKGDEEKYATEIAECYKNNNCDSFIVYGADFCVSVTKLARIIVANNYVNLKSALNSLNVKVAPLFLLTSGENDFFDSSNIVLFDRNIYQSSSFFPNSTIIDSKIFVKLNKEVFDELVNSTLYQSVAILLSNDLSIISKSFILSAINNIYEIECEKKYSKHARELLQKAATTFQIALSNSAFSICFSIILELYKNSDLPFYLAQNISLYSALSLDLKYTKFNFEDLPVTFFSPNEDDCGCGCEDEHEEHDHCNCEDDFAKNKNCFLNRLYDLLYFFNYAYYYTDLSDESKNTIISNLCATFKKVKKEDFKFILDEIISIDEEDIDEN